jgi:hypothetical protein
MNQILIDKFFSKKKIPKKLFFLQLYPEFDQNIIGRKGGRLPPIDSIMDENGAFYNTAKDRFSIFSSDFGNSKISSDGGSIFIHYLTDALT